MQYIIGFFAVIVILYFIERIILSDRREKNQNIKNEMFRAFKEKGFRSTIKHKFSRYFVAIDENSKRWFVMDMNDPGTTELRSFGDLIDVEILQDESTLVKASTAGVLGRGLAGAALLGPAGAIIGSSTASKKATSEITKLGIRLIFKDMANPMLYLDCLHCRDEVDPMYSLFVAIANKVAEEPVAKA